MHSSEAHGSEHDNILLCTALCIEKCMVTTVTRHDKANSFGYNTKRLMLQSALKLYGIRRLMHFPQVETLPVQ